VQPAVHPAIVPIDRIVATRERISARVHRTPMLSSRTAAQLVERTSGVEVADARIHLKAEHLQVTGSFKPRAASARVAALSPSERERGIITISAGNAAQAYGWAARDQGVRATVVMPAGAVRSKVDACRGYGAEVVLHGADVGETLAEMERLRVERDLVVCHPFDDPDVIAGNGSVGLEILEDLPEVDVAVVAIGGGGLISGVATALKELRPGIRVFGVEPVTSDAMRQAIAAGEPVRIQPTSVADGLGAPFAGAWTLPACQRYVDDIILLEDGEILSGLRFAVERLKQVLEPAGATALAALLHGRVPLRAGDRVVVVLSGGNVEVSRLGELLESAAPLPGTFDAPVSS
jgi:threonine dehydratase